MATIGTNYKSGRNFDEVLALMRSDLKNALPKGVKVSVQKDKSTWANKVSVCIMQAPEEVVNWQSFTGWQSEERCYTFVYIDKKRLTPYGLEIFEAVQRVILSYHYDDSDVMTDYFDTNFYYEMGAGRFGKPFKLTA